MVVPQLRVTSSPQFSPDFTPPTRGSINLIAGARSGTLASDKWVSSATRAPVLAHTRALIHAGVVLCPRTIWSKQVFKSSLM